MSALPPPAAAACKSRKAANDRASKLRRRAASRTPDHQALLNYAQELTFVADNAPDEGTRRDLYKIVRLLRLRHATSQEQQRDAVLGVLEKFPDGVSREEVAEDTGLDRQLVQQYLDELAGAGMDLVEIFTRGGRNNSGRGGTKPYYRLRHT